MKLEQACRLGPGSVESFTFQGAQLGPDDSLTAAGVSVGGAVSGGAASSGSGGGGVGADEALYPNAWYASSLNKAFYKVGGSGGVAAASLHLRRVLGPVFRREGRMRCMQRMQS